MSTVAALSIASLNLLATLLRALASALRSSSLPRLSPPPVSLFTDEAIDVKTTQPRPTNAEPHSKCPYALEAEHPYIPGPAFPNAARSPCPRARTRGS